MKYSFVYMTAKDKDEARKIGRALVQEKLAACVNIIDNMESIYRWEGKVEEGKETVLIAKTRKGLVGKLTKKVKSMHSYECPCVVALPVEGGSKEFLDWVRRETRQT